VPQSYALGLDGGQSSTICVLGTTDGTLISSGRGGPANHIGQPGGPKRLERALRSSMTEALCQVQPSIESLAAAYLSLTGGVQMAMEIVPAIVRTERVLAESDAIAALAAGTGAGPGVALIAGTGAVAVAINRNGQRSWSGGWGYLLGDEGSGYWIGLQALRAAARAEDGRGPATVLRGQILRRFTVPDMRAIFPRLYGEEITRPDVAGLAPLVLAVCEAGDRVATAIVESAADELSLLAESACAAAGFQDTCERVIVPTGGVLRPDNILWRLLAKRIAKRLPDYRLLVPRFPPVIGAYLLALQLTGIQIDDTLLGRVAASAARVPHIQSKESVSP
jgi:N-acetylglucosamine kinase-like BadF-type ATPase